MFAAGWFNPGWRGFAIEMNLYNVQTRFYTVLRMSIQMSASGNIITDTRIISYDLSMISFLPTSDIDNTAKIWVISKFILQFTVYLFFLIRLYFFAMWVYHNAIRVRFQLNSISFSHLLEVRRLYIRSCTLYIRDCCLCGGSCTLYITDCCVNYIFYYNINF